MRNGHFSEETADVPAKALSPGASRCGNSFPSAKTEESLSPGWGAVTVLSCSAQWCIIAVEIECQPQPHHHEPGRRRPPCFLVEKPTRPSKTISREHFVSDNLWQAGSGADAWILGLKAWSVSPGVGRL